MAEGSNIEHIEVPIADSATVSSTERSNSDPNEQKALDEKAERIKKFADLRRRYTPIVRQLVNEAVQRAKLNNKDVDRAGRFIDIESARNIDNLTGLRNREGFEQLIQHTLAEANRLNHDTRQIDLRLVLLDIDNFGALNHRVGLRSGDSALQLVAMAIQDSLKRKTDIPGRWGGEEFVVNLETNATPGVDTTINESLLPVVERIRQNIGNVHFLPEGSSENIPLSASLGTTTYRDGESFADYQNRADRAMIIAKMLGKNRIVDARFDEQGNIYYVDLSNQHRLSATFVQKGDGELRDLTDGTMYQITTSESGKPKLQRVA